jgi:hypothetical protein
MIIETVIKKICAAGFAFLMIFTGVANADSTILFAGADAREESDVGYAGLTYYFNEDILADGFLIRAVASRANYEYKTNFGETDADVIGSELMVGYQKVWDSFTARGLIGLDYEDHDFSPDNIFDDNRGSDTGVKVRAEVETDFSSPDYASLLVSYGSAKERYWARLRGGREFSGLVVGPELIFLGDQEYDEQRLGAFLMVKKLVPVSFTVSAGYADPDTDRGDSGPYLALEVSKTY